MKRRGNTLAATLIVVAIILVLVIVFFTGKAPGMAAAETKPRADGQGKTAPGRVMLAAKDDVCRERLGQVRAGIAVYKSTNPDENPSSIDQIKIGNEFYACPIGKEKYDYDPATGQVHCPHKGHEAY